MMHSEKNPISGSVFLSIVYDSSIHFVNCCKKCFSTNFFVEKNKECSDVDSLVMTIFVTLMEKSHKTHVVHGFCAILKITQNLGWEFFSAVILNR